MRAAQLVGTCSTLLALLLGPPGIVHAARVAVYQDPAFVDPPLVIASTGDRDDRVSHIERGLRLHGHSVLPLTDSSAASVSATLAAADVLLVAPLNADLGAAIDPAAASAIESFVAGGGGLVIHARQGFASGGVDPNAPFEFLDSVFGITGLTSDGAGRSESYVRTPAAAATAFAAGPASLASLSLTGGVGIITATLPAGALSLYEVPLAGTGGGPGTLVARFAHGAGRIIYLGFGWGAALPFRSFDSGWIEVLGLAVEDALGCGDPGASDGDGDGIADACDNCPATSHPLNVDCDEDGIGDVCDVDTIDADGDDRDDTCDPCVNLAGARTLDAAKLRIKSAAENEGSFDLKGQFVLPPGSSFADMDPLSSRVRIRATDDAARIVLDTTLPGLPFDTYFDLDFERLGWVVNGAGTTWVYKRARRLSTFFALSYYGGVRRVKLRDASNKAPGLVKVVVKSREWPIDAAGAAPVQADIAVGDASSGECTETAYLASDCKVGANVTSCK